MKSSYKGALALVCLSVRKNWRNIEMTGDCFNSWLQLQLVLHLSDIA